MNAELITGDLKLNTMTFEIQGEMVLKAGNYVVLTEKEYANLKSKESIPLGDIILNEFIQGVRNTKANGEARRFILNYAKSKLNNK